MKELEEYYTDNAIIRMLCKHRARISHKRHKKHMIRDISLHVRTNKISISEFDTDFFKLQALFPTRRNWKKLNQRERLNPNKLNNSIEKNTMRLWKSYNVERILVENDGKKPEEWFNNLLEFCSDIRQKVEGMLSNKYRIKKPQIIPLPKSSKKGKHIYRPIANYSLEDKIITSSFAKYLTELFDPVFLVSILFSFLCSVWEAVLLSITPSYVNIHKQKGTQLGKDLEAFKEDIDRPLSAILTLNTIAHTVGAIGVGAQAGHLWGENHIPLFGDFNISYESIIATVMTLAILILSEIIPKTLGANNWRQWAPFTVKSLKLLMLILRPLIWVSQKITKRLKKEKGKSVFSRIDFLAMTRASEESGALAENESIIIKNLLRFENITVRSIMTPRTVAIMADESQSIQEFYEQHTKLRHSRIPIYHGSVDDITGLVLKDEMLEHIISGHGDWPLSKLRKDILATHPNKGLPELFDVLTKNRSHLAVVVDEFGGVVGIVSMEDIVETLLGLEIVDELDDVEDLQELARKNWEERAKKRGLLE